MRLMLYVALALVAVAAIVVLGWWLVTRSVETPKYEVVAVDGAFEVRDYPALVAAEVSTRGSREEGVRRGFRPLAGYIFAKERPGEKIAMTAPVTQEAETATGAWSVRFIMPSRHSKDSLPSPAGERVRIVEIPPRRVAAVRFSGRADDADFERQTVALRAWMDARDLRAAGIPTLAYYDDPFTPGFLRRNEVLIPIERRVTD